MTIVKRQDHIQTNYVELHSIDECDQFKQIICKEFFPVRGFSEKASFAACWKAISDSKKMKPDPYFLADLMLYYIKNGCEYTMTTRRLLKR